MNLITPPSPLASPLNDNEILRAEASNKTERLFYDHRGRPCDKWHHYLAIYDRYLRPLAERRPQRVLEIGVQRGGSLELWRSLFGPQAVIHGLDIDPACAALSTADLPVHVGTQDDVPLLHQIVHRMGGIDIVIDDGGHVNDQQIATFEALYPLLSPDGIYICEDTHTSYWPSHGGGPPESHVRSFLQYTKQRIDDLHAAWRPADEPARSFAFATKAIHIYDSIVVFEREDRPQPRRSVVGAGYR